MARETGKAGAITGPMESVTDDLPNARLNHAVGAGRLHLAALDAVLTHNEDALSCGLVSQADGPPVLLVVSRSDRARSVIVGCERVDGVWWFVRADSDEGVVPVDAVESAPAVLVGMLADRGADLR